MSPLKRLEVRLRDAERLLEIHEAATGPRAGRRRNVDVLNRSAMILTIAAWEGFCEEAVQVSATRISRRLKRKLLLPQSVVTPLMYWFYEESQLNKATDSAKKAMWQIAEGGWRAEYRRYSEKKVDDLNTPSFTNLKKLMSNTLGISEFGSNWRNGRYGGEFYKEKLSAALNIRHRVAHGAHGDVTVGKIAARNAIDLIRRLSSWVAAEIAANELALDLAEQELQMEN